MIPLIIILIQQIDLASDKTPEVNNPDGVAIFIIFGLLIFITILLIFYQKKQKKSNKNSNKNSISINISRVKTKSEYKIRIKNNSKNYLEISAPLIIIRSFSTSRKMKVRSNNYPLTIGPKTVHSILFRKEQLIDNGNKKTDPVFIRVKILDNYNNILQSKHSLLL